MKILVGIKRVVDYTEKVRVKSDGSGIELGHVKMSINPFDEIAVEQAVQIKEQYPSTEIVLVSLGPIESEEVLKHGFALGADRGLLFETNQKLEPLTVAKCLVKITEIEKPDLIILGKQAIDDDCNQTGQMLASLLNWPQGCFISDLKIDNNQVEITREIDGGLETLSGNLPIVLTTDLRLNIPRYATLPNIMKAKSKPLEIKPIDSLGVDISPRLKVVKTSPPKERQGGVKLNSVGELIDKLVNQDKVLP